VEWLTFEGTPANSSDRTTRYGHDGERRPSRWIADYFP
jgi:hypothetical protein